MACIKGNKYAIKTMLELSKDSKNNIVEAYQKDLFLNPKLDKIYNVGDKALISYDLETPEDALILIKTHSFYDLSLKN